MFTLVESKKQISQAQRSLESTLRREFPRQEIRNIGHPGGGKKRARVLTNGHYWFWTNDSEPRSANPRRLNWFGIFHEGPGFGITVEINTGYEGHNNKIAGFFARDAETGVLYLMHSGRVGGGTKGVGKNSFLTWSNEPLVETSDASGNIRNGVVVMPLDGVAASRSLTRYIDLVKQFKLVVRDRQLDTPEFRKRQRKFEDFYKEGRGRRTGRRSSEIDYVSRHGDVVDAVRKWREARGVPKGSRFVKNVLIDMGVAVGKTLVEVFEVKTTAARQHIYSALGQLMVHGSDDKCRRVMVIPYKEVLAEDLQQACKALRIELLRYKLNKESATIVNAS